MQWAAWREQVEGDITFAEPGDEAHKGVRRVLEEARGYVNDPPPHGAGAVVVRGGRGAYAARRRAGVEHGCPYR